MIDFSPIDKLKMLQGGLTPDLLAALRRTNAFAGGMSDQLDRKAATLPVAPVKGPSILSRIGSGISNAASNVGDNLMATPDGMKQAGLLSDADIASAKRQGLLNLGASLLANSGPKTADQYVSPMAAIGQGVQAMQGAYKGAIDSSMAMKAGAQQYKAGQTKAEGDQMALDQAKKLPGLRSAIIQKNPMPDSNDHQAMLGWLDKVIPQFIDAGDDETVKHLSQIYLPLASQRDQLKPKFDTQDTGSQLIDRMIMPDGTIKVLGTTPKTATPNTLARGELMSPTARERAENNIIGSFDRQTKDYVKAHEAWTQVQHVLDRARSNTHSPDDIVQLLDGISRLNNPGAVVRTGTVQLQLEKIGSAEQKLRMWLDRGAKGAWPTDVIEGVGRAAREIAKEHQKQFNDLRHRAITRGNRVGLDYMDEVLPDTWGEGAVDPGAPGAPPGWHAPMALPGGPGAAIDPRLGGIPRKQ